jgi:hypothetical protein
MCSISGLGSIAQTWATQSTNSVNAPAQSERYGDNDGSSVSATSGSGRHLGGVGGGAFMQEVMQSRRV